MGWWTPWLRISAFLGAVFLTVALVTEQGVWVIAVSGFFLGAGAVGGWWQEA